MAKVLVVYHSGTGNTRTMAEAVAEGAKEVVGVEIILKEAEEASVNDLVAADAIAFGSPTYFSYMAGVLKALFDKAWLARSEISSPHPQPLKLNLKAEYPSSSRLQATVNHFSLSLLLAMPWHKRTHGAFSQGQCKFPTSL